MTELGQCPECPTQCTKCGIEEGEHCQICDGEADIYIIDGSPYCEHCCAHNDIREADNANCRQLQWCIECLPKVQFRAHQRPDLESEAQAREEEIERRKCELLLIPQPSFSHMPDPIDDDYTDYEIVRRVAEHGRIWTHIPDGKERLYIQGARPLYMEYSAASNADDDEGRTRAIFRILMHTQAVLTCKRGGKSSNKKKPMTGRGGTLTVT